MGYSENREWSDQFNLQLRLLLGPVLIREATPDEDRGSATDMVFETKALRISCRVRTHTKDAYDKFGGQFTLRTQTTYGLSELEKVMRGDVDLLLYCWGNGETRRIREWVLIDLRVFSCWVAERIEAGKAHMADRGDNGDGTSWGAWWIHLLPADAVMATGIGLQIHEDCLEIL
jgi:hypothetical protein